MFAEEIGSSSAKRRQEQNRNRRRQLKQQQKKKKEKNNATAGAVTNTAAAGASSAAAAADGSTAAAPSAALPAATTAAASAVSAASTPAVAKGDTSVSSGAAAGVTSTSSSANNNNSQQQQPQSAVEIAKQQRKIRAENKAKVSAATVIQSYLRAYRSNINLRDEEGKLFDNRTSDLITLGNILKQAGKTTEMYVPPPATVSVMASQLLFLTGRTPHRGSRREGGDGEASKESSSAARKQKPTDSSSHHPDDHDVVLDKPNLTRLYNYLTYVLLPGLQSSNSDANLDPLLPWLDTFGGRARLARLLVVCMACLTSTAGATSDVEESRFEAAGAVDTFFRLVMGIHCGKEGHGDSMKRMGARARDVVVKYCREKLLRPEAILDISPTQGNNAIGAGGGGPSSSSNRSTNNDDSSLDLIRQTRTFLLYGGGKSPIPPEADKVRERCISDRDRKKADRCFALVFDVVLELESTAKNAATVKLRSRFVEEVLTVPLLTWKVSPLASSKLIAVSKLSTNPAGKSEEWRRQQQQQPLVNLLRSFASRHAKPLSEGRVRSVLPLLDVPPTSCPAPAVMCLLANLVQLGRVCNAINGTDPSMLDFDAAASFFNVLSTLIDAAPLGALSSRHSAVEWVSDGTGSHHTPIVLSTVVIEQCKALLVDSYVRNLFTCAIDDGAIGTEETIRTKNEKDLKYEKEISELGATSAASLAAKEAMVDRTKGFWQSSKWARKLSKSVTTLLSSDAAKAPKSSSTSPKGAGKLVNTSLVSRKLAKDGSGQGGNVVASAVASAVTDVVVDKVVREKYTTDFLFALCRAYGSILARWGGSGKDDIVRRAPISSKSDSRTNHSDASEKADPLVLSLLNVMCFATDIVKTLWAIIQSDSRVFSDLYAVIDSDKGSAPIRALQIRAKYDVLSGSIRHTSSEGNLGSALLFVFLTCMAHVLIVTDDIEIHDMGKPLPPHQLRRCILLLKRLLYRACCVDDVNVDRERDSLTCDSNYFGLALIAGASKTMRDLYDRSSRRPLCVPKLWLVEDLLEKEIRRCKHHEEFASLLSLPVLRVCPFLVSFKRRLKLFERLVTTDRIALQGSNDQHNLRPGVIVRIMRGRVLEDGLVHLNNLGRNLRQRIVVQYISQVGTTETGVDVGGLFKEFWSDLSNLAFDPNYALFRATEGSGNCLYPNPSSRAAHGSDHIVLFEFLGRILGKALYEGITIQPQFAHFFLSFLRGDYNFLHMLPDLSTMDPQLYNNLMFLKTYEGDASDLCLNFTVANDDFGGNEEVSLIPNGVNIEVTNVNKQRYIGLVAKHHVCDRVKEQSQAFTRGLWEVIDRKWLLLFNEPELQVLISGASDGRIDVADMKAHARYAGGYSGLDKHVYRFWNVVSSFSPKEQAELLRFVTSCERPPPLGFSSMNPPFTVQRVGILRDGDKLPSASTCFNTLKLPTYSSEKVLKQRLLYAIQSGAGFELT